MMQPSALRDRITEYCYMAKSTEDPIYRVEHAFAAVVAAEIPEQKIHQALKKGLLPKTWRYTDLIQEALAHHIVTSAEADLLLQAHTSSLDAIQVDSFDRRDFATEV